MSIYDSGAAFLQGGKLQVTDKNEVDNLNAHQLQGKEPKDFIQTGSVFGLTQSGKTATAAGVTVSNTSVNYNFDANSTIKIGNVVIKSSNGGNGILIGIE